MPAKTIRQDDEDHDDDDDRDHPRLLSFGWHWCLVYATAGQVLCTAFGRVRPASILCRTMNRSHARHPDRLSSAWRSCSARRSAATPWSAPVPPEGGAGQALAPVADADAVAHGVLRPRQYERWTVGVATGPFTVLQQPDAGGPVLDATAEVNVDGYPTVVLVDETRDVGGSHLVPGVAGQAPNEHAGLGARRPAGLLPDDLEDRHRPLAAQADGVPARRARGARFPVAVGRPGLATPTGFFFINQKLRPSSPNGAYGVLALGTSAYQPKLPDWPGGGLVGIHGTNEPWLIGKAISHGCVRMHNKDILAGQPAGAGRQPRHHPEVAAAARRTSPVLALVQLHVVGLALGAGVRGGLLEEEELAAADHAAELVDVDVGAGEVDLDDGPALDAVPGHEALPRVVARSRPSGCARPCSRTCGTRRSCTLPWRASLAGVSLRSIGRIAGVG